MNPPTTVPPFNRVLSRQTYAELLTYLTTLDGIEKVTIARSARESENDPQDAVMIWVYTQLANFDFEHFNTRFNLAVMIPEGVIVDKRSRPDLYKYVPGEHEYDKDIECFTIRAELKD